MSKRKLLVTGASGMIAGQILPALRERYELTLTDVKNTDRQGEVIPEVQIADLTDGNREAYRHLFTGKDVVVHCGYIRPADKGDVHRPRYIHQRTFVFGACCQPYLLKPEC